MKKSIISCLCMAVLVMFTACNKDQDGVYNPAKKIQKIYSVNDGVQQVKEVWHWDGKLLTSIDLYEEGQLYTTNTFHYDGDRLTTLRNGYSYATFNYNGKMIDKIEVFYPGIENPMGTYVFEYDGKKLKRIVLTVDYSSIVDKKSILNPLRYVVPTSCAAVESIIAQHANEAKEYTEKITLDLTWTGNNVTSVVATEESTVMGITNTTSSLTQCTFDNKENPVKGFIAALLGATNMENLYCNKNNMLTNTTSQNGVVYSSTTNVYEYDGNFPTKVTSTKTENGNAFVSSCIYEY